MRVNTGTAKGRVIETLPGEDLVRPTSQKVKEALFSALQFFIPGATMLDLFAGSGQMGIEALSRGASHCVFVDNSREAITVIKKNLNNTDLFSKATVAQMDAIRYIERASLKFDFIFADPPYHKEIAGALLPHLDKMLEEGGCIAIETEREANLPDEVLSLVLKKRYNYGSTTIWMYNKRESEDEQK
ncbi:MAG: 16S rRNA (guanine(966)-N(2))-methyltransferase RsmD [Oscillospiraceae bacterium]|nr:16S rRNA (guanine(966)-N(2))-methyltransferase RsmD [Oscillospiraceae bacterium]